MAGLGADFEACLFFGGWGWKYFVAPPFFIAESTEFGGLGLGTTTYNSLNSRGDESLFLVVKKGSRCLELTVNL